MGAVGLLPNQVFLSHVSISLARPRQRQRANSIEASPNPHSPNTLSYNLNVFVLIISTQSSLIWTIHSFNQSISCSCQIRFDRSIDRTWSNNHWLVDWPLMKCSEQQSAILPQYLGLMLAGVVKPSEARRGFSSNICSKDFHQSMKWTSSRTQRFQQIKAPTI